MHFIDELSVLGEDVLYVRRAEHLINKRSE